MSGRRKKEPHPSDPPPTLAEVLKRFEEADIDKADDFIKAIQEQLNEQDSSSTSSSNKDKLSNWASFIQSGATFLKFASDQTEKNRTKRDCSQSGEVTKIVGDMLQTMGHLHWAVAGLSIVGYLVSKCHKVSANRTGYVDLLKDMFKLASHIKRLHNLSHENENKEDLKNAFRYIVQGAIYCARQLDSGRFFSFLNTSINSDTLSNIGSKIDKLYEGLPVIAGMETLAQLPLFLPLSQPEYPKNTVGTEDQAEAVIKLLNMKKSEDCSSSAVVIWGVGGIGKTTLAQAVVSIVDLKSYNYARIELDEISERNNYKVLQQQILRDAFPSYSGGRELNLRNDADGRDKLAEAFKRERNKPVFLFIDNALHAEALEKILPDDLQGLPQRSRILITTRILTVTQVLEDRGLVRKHYPVEYLRDNHAAQILCNDPATRNAIKNDLEKMVNLCNGIPLVLKIVGAHLRRQKYEVERCTQIVNALQSGGKIKESRLSNRLFDFVYNLLEESTQEAFLDICCFFDKGFPRRIAEYIVGHQEVAFLQEAALITTVRGKSLFLGGLEKSWNYQCVVEGEEEEEEEEEELLSVHDIIRSIGRSLSKSSRITDLKSWNEAEKNECKLKEIKGVWLINNSCTFREKHINSMKDKIRILVWNHIKVEDEDEIIFPELRWMATASDIPWVNVEELDQLGMLECVKLPSKKGDPLKLPERLRSIRVARQPSQSRDFVPNSCLEELKVSFGFANEQRDNSENAFYYRLHDLKKLKVLSVHDCSSLCELPREVCKLPQLRKLVLRGCCKLERLPESFEQLQTLTHLNLSHCENLERLPKSFGQLKTLTYLNLSNCSCLKELPKSFGQLKALQYLQLCHCSSLEKLPSEFEQLRSLEHLNLRSCYKLGSDICLWDGTIKIVQKSQHSCHSVCRSNEKLKIRG